MVMLDKAKNKYQEIDEQTMDQMAHQMSGAMAQMDAAMKNMPPEQRAMMEKMMKGKMPQAAAAPVKTVYTAKAAAASMDSAAPSMKGCGAPKGRGRMCRSSRAAQAERQRHADLRKDAGVLQRPP